MKVSASTIFILILFFCAPAIALTNSLPTEEADYAVIVNGEKILLSKYRETEKALRKVFEESGEVNLESEEGKEALRLSLKSSLDSLIDSVLTSQGAIGLGIEVTEHEIRQKIEEVKKDFPSPHDFHASLARSGISVSDLRDNLRKQILNEKIMQILEKEIKINGKEVRKFYEININLFVQPERLKLKRIILTSESSVPFEDMGYIEKGDLPEKVEEVAFSLKSGEISNPILVDDKYWILKVEEKLRRRETKFEEVKERIEEFLKDEKKKDAFYRWVAELRSKAKIVYNQELEDLEK